MDEAEAAGRIALEAWKRGPRHGRFVELLGTHAYFKQSVLAGRASLRYALKSGILRARLPRLREFDNLGWLRAHGLHAPEPLAAGALWRAGLPRFQFLFTRAVAGAETLEEFLAGGAQREGRAKVLDELARETARMHALGFVHHDLFPRNLLVAFRQVSGGPRGSQGSARVWFLDCWAGGTSPQMRGPAYDLACLTLRGRETLAPEELGRFLEVYAAGRTARGRPVEIGKLSQKVGRERARLARRLSIPL